MSHKDTIRPIILAGGAGKRLWPVSRALYPKQFQRLGGTRTLLQDTVGRVSSPQFSAPVVICSEEHRFIVGEQLADCGIVSAEIILEPTGRGTGPAIVLAAHWMRKHDPDGIMLILPSDHVIDGTDAFIESLGRAKISARSGALVTFGVPADGAQTAYGYIQPETGGQPIPVSGAPVSGFKEKPDAATAAKMLAHGALWNSGIFLISARACLDEARRYALEIVERCNDSMAQAECDMDFLRIAEAPFLDNPAISFDQLVLEKTDKAIVFPLKARWLDLHTWSAVYEHAQPDENDNVLDGDVMAHGCQNMFIRSDQMLTAAIGLKNMAIIATDDAILVTDIRQTENVEKTVDVIALAGGSKHLHHSTIYKPWGSSRTILSTDEFQVKELVMKPGASLSLQKHMHRAEHWVVVEGTAEVLCNGHKTLLQENESLYIAPGSLHRLANPGRISLRIVEVQSGLCLGEDDIIRFENTNERHA